LQHVDYIMVMREGMVSDFGPAKDIMAKFTGRVAAPGAAKAVQGAPKAAVLGQQGGK
jgi:ABC-type protease/lipase transport system fused ATPase/permease subunit